MNIFQCLFPHQFAYMSCLHILEILNFSAHSQFFNSQILSSNFLSIGFLGIVWFLQQQHRQFIFSTSTSEIVMGLTRILSLFLLHGTHPVRVFQVKQFSFLFVIETPSIKEDFFQTRLLQFNKILDICLIKPRARLVLIQKRYRDYIFSTPL